MTWDLIHSFCGIYFFNDNLENMIFLNFGTSKTIFFCNLLKKIKIVYLLFHLEIKIYISFTLQAFWKQKVSFYSANNYKVFAKDFLTSHIAKSLFTWPQVFSTKQLITVTRIYNHKHLKHNGLNLFFLGITAIILSWGFGPN